MRRKSQLPDTYTFPAIFEDSSECYIVKFPDFPDHYTMGKDYVDSFKKSKETLGLHIYMSELKKEEIPQPTSIDKVSLDNNQIVCLIDLDMELIRSRFNKKYVKRTLMIPGYLNIIGEREGVNFSEILKEALIEKLNEKG